MNEPEIITIPPKKLAGLSVEMSYTKNLTGMVWGQFMQRRMEILNPISQNKYSVQVFKKGFNWYQYDTETKFKKWATMEISKDDKAPADMDVLNLEGGLYAVIIHRGLASGFYQSLQFILNEWLPRSKYQPDYTRPQFEVLGEKYKNNDPNSEEEIWFPIIHKEQ